MAKVIILSGAGISAESGISTFRDGGGLWEKHKIEDVCYAGCLEKNRKLLKIGFLLGLLISLFLFIFAAPISNLILGNDYRQSIVT